jgi:hypothetical protein
VRSEAKRVGRPTAKGWRAGQAGARPKKYNLLINNTLYILKTSNFTTQYLLLITTYYYFMRYFLLLFLYILPFFVAAQDTEPAIYKKDKKLKYSFKYTAYLPIEGYNLPMMRVPEDKIREVKTPAAGFMLELQAHLETAAKAYWDGEPVGNVERMAYCVDQIKSLDPYWEHSAYKLELDHYAVYEQRRYERDVVSVRRRDSLNQLRSRQVEDSLRRVFAHENRMADSLERARERYLYSKRDSIIAVERTRGYHFVNRPSINLRAAPDPNAPLIVNMRACTYLKVLTKPDPLGYVYVEVSDYKGYTLHSHLVDHLDKINTPRADVRFAKANHYVSIYIPAGATYDPLRPHLGGKVPDAKSPTDTTPFVYKPYEPKFIKVDKPEIADKPAEPYRSRFPVESREKPAKADKNAKKQTPTSSNLHQCTSTRADGSLCPNMTTTVTKKCYLHDE